MAKTNTFKNFLKERLKDIPYTVLLCVYFIITLSCGIYFSVLNQGRSIAISYGFIAIIPIFLLLEYGLQIRFVPLFTALFFIMCIGGILGSCFDFYNFPLFDAFLHTLSGVLVLLMGMMIMNRILNNVNSHKNFFTSILFGVFFSLGIALIWEMCEYFGTTILPVDMEEDMIIHEIKSFVLAGTHGKVVHLTDISKTVIYYGDNQTFTIDGYLDIGLFDTLNDMLVCMLGTIATAVILIVNRLLNWKLDKILIPQVVIKQKQESSSCVNNEILENEKQKENQ